MLTPKDILLQLQQWEKVNGHAPGKMTINPDTWNFLTKPDPSQIDPKPQPTTFAGVPVRLDPGYDPNVVSFE